MDYSSDEIDRAISEAVSEEMQLMGNAGLTAAVGVSPVDSGRFKGSWQVGAGQQPAPPPEGVDPSGQSTLARGRGEIAKYRKGNLILESDLPYSDRIDNGWSGQAPAGVSNLAVAAAVSVPDENKDI